MLRYRVRVSVEKVEEGVGTEVSPFVYLSSSSEDKEKAIDLSKALISVAFYWDLK